MPTELFEKDIVPERTWEEIFQVAPASDTNPIPSTTTDVISGGRYVGVTLENAFYRSAVSGGRVEILPDPNTGFVCYASDGTVVFKTVVGSTDVGDVIIGNYAGGQGAKWDQSAGTFTVVGTLNVTSINIPDLVTANSFHVDSSGNAWWGATTIGSAVAKILNTGAATFTNIQISGIQAGSSIDSTYLTSIGSAKLNIADRGWNQTCMFSITDLDTVEWSVGHFVASDGTDYSIGVGNTGNMSAKTYIYLDTAVSSTAYQVTTTASTAVGAGKCMVAIAQNGAVEPTFTVFGGGGGVNIDASSIVTGSITANEIAATTITAGKMNITTLSSIVANMGTITAGTITIDTAGYIRGGQTAYNTGTGFFLGYSTDTYKFSVGNPSGKYIAWNGTDFDVNGFLLSTIRVFGGDGSDGELNISSGGTELDCSGLPFLIKNYTSISITGSARLTFSNPGANGTIVVLKSQGDVTITSTYADGAIQLSYMGGNGGAGGASQSSGSNGSKGILVIGDEATQGLGGAYSSSSDDTSGGAAYTIKGLYTVSEWVRLSRKGIFLACGSGGGGGAGSGQALVSGGNGGKGGGAMIIECGGSLNFGLNSKIYASGQNGFDGQGGTNFYGSGGGGGGSGGMVLIIANGITTNEGTIYTTGGDGGDGGATYNEPAGNPAHGGSGGGAWGGAGGYGGHNNTSGQAGQGAGAGGGGGGSVGFQGSPTYGGSGGTSLVCLVCTNYDYA